MTIEITPYLSIIIEILWVIGFLLLLKGFWGLRTVDENGKTTITGKIHPKLIKIGFVLIIAGFVYSVIRFFGGFGLL